MRKDAKDTAKFVKPKVKPVGRIPKDDVKRAGRQNSLQSLSGAYQKAVKKK